MLTVSDPCKQLTSIIMQKIQMLFIVEIDDIKMTTVKNSQDDQLERPEATGELYEAINGLLKIFEELRDNGEGNIESGEERITDKEKFHIYTSLVEHILKKTTTAQ